METAIDTIANRVKSLRNRYASFDQRTAQVILARAGEWQVLQPDLFSDNFDKMTVANMIDTTARDIAAVLAPLPTISCSSATAHPSDRARAIADKRSKIARSYVDSSRLQWQMNRKGADQLHTFGMLVFCIEPDFENNRPLIRVKDAPGTYPVFNSMGDVVEIARVYTRPWIDIAAEYGLRMDECHNYGKSPTDLVEVVEYSNSKGFCTFTPQMGNKCLVPWTENAFGKCNYVVVTRPSLLDGAIKGAYDDMIWVQLVRHRLQMLILEGVEDAVQAPLVAPDDVQEIPVGSRAIMRTRNPSGVGRVRMDIPPQAFTLGETLREEMREGAMSPGVRAGDSDASVITGKGVNALQGMYQSQINALQTQIADGLTRVIEMAFEYDEKVFANVRKEIRGQDAGVPYKETYTPIKDINGDYTVDISYGFAAGIGDPNRALVYLLQANQAGLVSRDYTQRSMPGGISPADESKKIQEEQLRDALIASLAGMAQTVPEMAAMGGDPTTVVKQIAAAIKAIQKGDSPEEAVLAALTPEPAPEAPAPAAPAPGPEMGLPGLPGPTPEQGPPDLLQTFASIAGNGQAKMTSGVSMNRPI